MRQCFSLIAIAIVTYSPLSQAQDWNYSIEAYAMASSIEGDAGVGRISGVPVDVGFDDILENLELAGMVHFEALRETGWGFSLDYGFMDLGADIATARGGVIDTSVRQGIFEALALNRRKYGNGTLDFSIGLRWWDNDVDTLVDPAILPGTPSAAIEEDWLDLVVGARSIQRINDNWSFQARADVGGFSLQSELTASLSAGALYELSDAWTLDLQYKALWVNFEDGDRNLPGYFSYDTVTHGPIVGFIYKF